MQYFICVNCDAVMPDRGGYFEGRELACRECGTVYEIKRNGSHLYIEEKEGGNEDRPPVR